MPGIARRITSRSLSEVHHNNEEHGSNCHRLTMAVRDVSLALHDRNEDWSASMAFDTGF